MTDDPPLHAWRLRTWLLLATLPGLLLPLPLAALLGLAPTPRALATLAAVMAAQIVLTGAALAWVAWRRAEQPAQWLAEQAAALSALEPVQPLDWPAEETWSPLAAQLDAVQGRLQQLQQNADRRESELRKLAMYDPLTALPNRLLMREVFTHEAAVARRAGIALALLLLNVDRFRQINDTYGQAVGDEVLEGIAQHIAQTLRESDFVCRLGGDEFMVLLSDPGGWDRVAAAAQRLRAAVEAPLTLPRSGHAVQLSARIGITMYPSDGGDFDTLSRTANLALAIAKDVGRGSHAFYHPRFDAELRERANLERDLLEAMSAGQLSLHYQGVVDRADGAVVGCEALLRWQHPVRGLLGPGDFVDAAAQAGVLRELTHWTLEAACRQYAAWAEADVSPGRLAVNLSTRQVQDPTVPDAVRDALARHGLHPRLLELELTEDSMRGDPDVAARALQRLRALGVALTLDDFGTGPTSLAHLKLLHPDRLKIEGSFVAGLPGCGEDCALIEGMLGMADALGIEVVAEGVESAAQSDWLLARGCRVQQGFLLGRPLPVAEFEDWLARQVVPA